MPHPVQPVAGHVVDAVRITGALASDARLVCSTGREAHRFLLLDLQPGTGFPYHAQVDLGADADGHRAVQQLLPQLHAGAVVSVGGAELRLRTDHDRAVFCVLGARNVLLLQDPIPNPVTPAAGPDLFGGA